MEEKKKSNKIMFIILGIVIVALIGIVAFLILKLNSNNNQVGENSNNSITTNSNNTSTSNNTKVKALSFQQMDYTDNSLTDEQKIIAKFFDEDYFFLYSYEELVRYADMLKNMSMSCYAQVNSILSSDNENFEAVCQWANADDEFWGVDNAELTAPIIIKGKKPEKMIIKGDTITIKGKLVGAETRTINGESKYLPVVETIELGENYIWYNDDTIKQVANLVFGNNIKVRQPTDDEMNKMVTDYFYTFQNHFSLIEFENQSNLNFKVFDIWKSNPNGLITYNALYNQGVEKDISNKRLYITPDLQKYIVFDMSKKDRDIYISVYDKNLNKLWSREMSNASQITWDATNTNLVFVSDNDFYNIDIETGEDIFDPVLVGKRQQVRIVDNGYILVGNDRDDNIIFLDTTGKIKNKFDINIGTKDIPDQQIENTAIQKIDNNYIILYNMYSPSNHLFFSKYVIINENGEKVKESE